jgi:hypothetical protein
VAGFQVFVSGHGFSRAVTKMEMKGALAPAGFQVAGFQVFVSGHGFSRAVTKMEMKGALAPAGFEGARLQSCRTGSIKRGL